MYAVMDLCMHLLYLYYLREFVFANERLVSFFEGFEMREGASAICSSRRGRSSRHQGAKACLERLGSNHLPRVCCKGGRSASRSFYHDRRDESAHQGS